MKPGDYTSSSILNKTWKYSDLVSTLHMHTLEVLLLEQVELVGQVGQEEQVGQVGELGLVGQVGEKEQVGQEGELGL